MGYRPLIFILFLMVCPSVFARTNICDHIVLEDGDMRFSRNERTLICGTGGGGEDGWSTIPLPQAQFQINVLLQNDGYLNARFEREGDRLSVWRGPRSDFRRLEIKGNAPELDPSKKRKIIGFPMTPGKLDEVEQWADLKLRTSGHACPKVELSSEAWSGLLTVIVDPGPRQRISSLRLEGWEGLDQHVLARYQAFHVGKIYDVREVQLTTSRLTADGLFQSAIFDTDCKGSDVDLILRVTPGLPKMLRFGVGASTEELPFVDLSFRNVRLDNRASSLSATLHASPRVQSFDFGSEFYVLGDQMRTYLGPRFRVAHEAERAFETVKAELGTDVGRDWQADDARWSGRFGPTLNKLRTLRGFGPEDVSYLSWDGSLRVMGHDAELFARDQYNGTSAFFRYRGQRKGAGADVNVDRYHFEAKDLWNIGAYSPPLLVLGSRLNAIAVDADENALEGNRDLVPSDYRIFYGGDQNLRGFPRQSLANGGLGYLTAVSFGFELRLIEELPFRLEPFLLLDVGWLGNDRFRVEKPILLSEGGGLRWASPFGTLRGTVARGRIVNGDETTAGIIQQWVYFVSFGQEF